MPAANRNDRIKAVHNTLQLLELILELDGAGITELAESAHMSKSAIYKHLSTLEDHGYIIQMEDGTYDLSLRWLRFGGYARRQQTPLLRLQTAVRELANETDELVLFSTYSNDRSMPLYHARGEYAVTTDSHAGVELPLHCTATGKAMLAAMGTDAKGVLDRIELTSETENTITDPEVLLNELTEIREQGFALEDQERIEGMRGIGAAVTNERTDEVLGAIALTGPTHRVEGERFRDTFPKLIANRAREIEINITYE